jgi:rare lipoprotein A
MMATPRRLPTLLPLTALLLISTASLGGCAHRHTEEGKATWYGPGFVGKHTANGERFWPCRLTAAHKTLPFDTRVKVTNLENGKVVRVRINDRGPFGEGRIIDLSRAAAAAIKMVRAGVVKVEIEVIKWPKGHKPES